MTVRRSAVAMLLALAVGMAAEGWVRRAGGAADVPADVRFNQHVRPTLTDKCFPCHGPDANKRQADLRLDVRESALADRDGVRAIVPGNARESELVRRISSRDPDYRMPPPSSHRTLSAREIATLTRWVEQGAAYQPHWAYMPVERPALPPVRDAARAGNPVDRFILARLEERGLTPSPEADARTLARRVSFDLVGLPPAPEDVEAFAADPSDAAYEALVDRLLASPHYGERMAVYWLDLVRFADTNGYNEDQHHNIFPYRDWVIRAFNDDMPFDEFTVEQLAGDLLPDPTLSQRIASGYNRLNKVSTENGSQPKEFVAKYAADRVRTTATVWMGATVGCAECHDHKFDPYTSRDFYRFAAFFADIEEEAVPNLGTIAMPPEVTVPPADLAATLEDLRRRRAELVEQRSAAVARAPEDFAAARLRWEHAAPAPSPKVVNQEPPFMLSAWSASAKGVAVDDAGRLRLRLARSPGRASVDRTVAAGPGDLQFALDVSAIAFPERSGVLEAFSWDVRQPKRHSGLNVTISRAAGKAVSVSAKTDPTDVRTVEVGASGDVKSVRLRAVWDASRRTWSVGYGINGAAPATPLPGGPMLDVSPVDVGSAWSETIAVFAFPQEERAASEGDERDVFEAALGEHRVAAYDRYGDPRPDVAVIRATTVGQRTPAQAAALDAYWLSVAPALAAVNAKIDELDVRQRVLETARPHTLVTVATTPHVTRVLHRGDWLDETGEVVTPGVPEFLPPLPADTDANRLALARWLVSPANPLTARVLVNRLWKLFYGRGIASTLDDLGSQGTPPTHPELLDWLASELVESGWNVKHVVQLLVTSRTYRQASADRADLRDVDPDNHLYARQSPVRLDAEMVRDNALAVSGLLSPEIGGPSVKPYQPANYWDDVSRAIPGSPGATWTPSAGADQYRRGLYTYWKRTFLHPSLLAFDAPTREESVAERPRSSTPLQALALLNDPTYVEAARVFAERTARDGGSDPDAQIRWAYRHALSREPEARALGILRDVYDRHLEQYRADPAAAARLARVGFSPPAAEWDRDPGAVAALASVCRVLLNTNEAITRY